MRDKGFKKRVGKYYLGQTLGEGTYAKVKYGQHVDTGEAVAIKVLDKSKIIKGEMVEQIQREITIMRHLSHPNIVNLKEVMSSKDKIYMVMELVTGGELFDRIATEGPMKEHSARRIFCELLDGLHYCHSQGVYHRDLKPENVLLAADGTAKLSDFGLGALQSHTHYDGLFMTTCGTPNYVAPEVLRKRGYQGGPADIWSLGVVLYVMLAGCLPFEEPDLATLFRRISRAQYDVPPWFSSEQRQLLAKMLVIDPDERTGFSELRSDPWVQAANHRWKSLPRSLSSDSMASDDILRQTVQPEAVSQEEQLAAAAKTKTHGRLNAFELLNSALDISAIFEHKDDVVTRRTRFTSKASTHDLLAALQQSTKAKGGSVHVQGSNTSWLRIRLPDRNHRALVVDVHVGEMVGGLKMVEVAKYSGHSVEFYSFYKYLMESLDGIILKRVEQPPMSPVGSRSSSMARSGSLEPPVASGEGSSTGPYRTASLGSSPKVSDLSVQMRKGLQLGSGSPSSPTSPKSPVEVRSG